MSEEATKMSEVSKWILSFVSALAVGIIIVFLGYYLKESAKNFNVFDQEVVSGDTIRFKIRSRNKIVSPLEFTSQFSYELDTCIVNPSGKLTKVPEIDIQNGKDLSILFLEENPIHNGCILAFTICFRSNVADSIKNQTFRCEGELEHSRKEVVIFGSKYYEQSRFWILILITTVIILFVKMLVVRVKRYFKIKRFCSHYVLSEVPYKERICFVDFVFKRFNEKPNGIYQYVVDDIIDKKKLINKLERRLSGKGIISKYLVGLKCAYIVQRGLAIDKFVSMKTPVCREKQCEQHRKIYEELSI